MILADSSAKVAPHEALHGPPIPPSLAAERMFAGVKRKGFEPEALHAYTDAIGHPIHWRLRAKRRSDREKWIRPMRVRGMVYELVEPELPDGKPLYRLHELAAESIAPVIVTEGEFKADKLAARGLQVTTSGSADSAAKADWLPLAGRDVLIWPDNDDAGRRYADSVVAVLKPLGCTVRVIDVLALGLEAKGDAVNWLAVHPEATASDVLALACVPCSAAEPELIRTSDAGAVRAQTEASSEADDAPNSFSYGAGRFEMTERGVMFTATDDDGDERAPVWVCSPLSVSAKTRDNKSDEWGRLLEWVDDDGVHHQWPMPLELLQGDGVNVRSELARRGLSIAPGRKSRDLLSTYVQVWPVKVRARCVVQLGWHGPVYVTPQISIGETDEIVVFQNSHAVEPAFSASGRVDEWRDSVARLAQGNSRMVFAMSVAFAAPLANIVGEDSGGFHLRGGTSIGKSTLLKAAASVWGDPVAYPRLWRATANGLEGLAALHNDGLLIIDELSQVDPRQAGEAAYLLANGKGKTRATRSGIARQAASWRLLFLSAGEESLSALMLRVGRKANAGQEIRLADIEADAGVGMGVFETLNGCASSAALSLAIKDAATTHHGAVGLAWLRVIVPDRDKLADLIADGIRQSVDEHAPDGASGQVLRVAQRFGLVAAAGELAAHYGLTGWSEGEAARAAGICFAAWLDSFGGVGNREDRALLAQVRGFLETHGSSRFEAFAGEDDQKVINRAGFYRTGHNGDREFLVLPEAFKRDVCAGFDLKTATRCLAANGWIKPGGDGRTTQKIRLPGIGNSRAYVFDAKWASAE